MASSSARVTMPIRFFRRCLAAVIIWSTIALVGRPATFTGDSLGKIRATFDDKGTTRTRDKLRFAASLLTITAGRVLRISLPTLGSNSTHQTSPRFIGDVVREPADPLGRLGFSHFVSRHLAIAALEG